MVNLNWYARYTAFHSPEVMGTMHSEVSQHQRTLTCRQRSSQYKLLTHAYHLGLPFLWEMWFIICSHIHTVNIGTTLKISYNSIHSLSLDVSTEKSVALYITVMGRVKVYPTFGKRDHWICHLCCKN